MSSLCVACLRLIPATDVPATGQLILCGQNLYVIKRRRQIYSCASVRWERETNAEEDSVVPEVCWQRSAHRMSNSGHELHTDTAYEVWMRERERKEFTHALRACTCARVRLNTSSPVQFPLCQGYGNLGLTQFAQVFVVKHSLVFSVSIYYTRCVLSLFTRLCGYLKHTHTSS